MAEFAMRSLRRRSALSDAWSQDLGVPEPRNMLADRLGSARASPHALDGEASRAVLRQLLEWYYFEKDRQLAGSKPRAGSLARCGLTKPGPRPASRRLAGTTRKRTRCAASGSDRSMTGRVMQQTPLGSCAWWRRGASGGQSPRAYAGVGVRWRCERNSSSLRNFRLRFVHAMPPHLPADAACACMGAVEFAAVHRCRDRPGRSAAQLLWDGHRP